MVIQTRRPAILLYQFQERSTQIHIAHPYLGFVTLPTLFRTVSGMRNYAKAIKLQLLYHVETPEVVQMFGGNTNKLERELERMARRKFKLVISMQRYSKVIRKNTRTQISCFAHTETLRLLTLKKIPAKTVVNHSFTLR